MVKLWVSDSTIWCDFNMESDVFGWYLNIERIMNEEHPHILCVHCILHMFNLFAKRIVNHPSMEVFSKGNKKLVSYFTTAGFWHKNLSTWQKTNGVEHGLETLGKTCWYSISKVCLGVQSHKLGFWKCLDLLNEPMVYTPMMTAAVVKVIKDCDHLTANQTLMNSWRLWVIISGIQRWAFLTKPDFPQGFGLPT